MPGSPARALDDRTNAQDPSPQRKRRPAGNVAGNHEDKPHDLLPKTLKMTGEPEVQFGTVGAIDMAVDTAAEKGIKRMREGGDADRVKDDGLTLQELMDQEAMDDEAESNEMTDGKAGDKAVEEKYANGVSADKNALGVGAKGEDSARRGEHKEANERKGTEAESNEMTDGKADGMAVDEEDEGGVSAGDVSAGGVSADAPSATHSATTSRICMARFTTGPLQQSSKLKEAPASFNLHPHTSRTA